MTVSFCCRIRTSARASVRKTIMAQRKPMASQRRKEPSPARLRKLSAMMSGTSPSSSSHQGCTTSTFARVRPTSSNASVAARLHQPPTASAVIAPTTQAAGADHWLVTINHKTMPNRPASAASAIHMPYSEGQGQPAQTGEHKCRRGDSKRRATIPCAASAPAGSQAPGAGRRPPGRRRTSAGRGSA